MGSRQGDKERVERRLGKGEEGGVWRPRDVARITVNRFLQTPAPSGSPRRAGAKCRLEALQWPR